jgi:hypothetical protein
MEGRGERQESTDRGIHHRESENTEFETKAKIK